MNPRLLAVLILVVVIVAGSGAWWLLRGQPSAPLPGPAALPGDTPPPPAPAAAGEPSPATPESTPPAPATPAAPAAPLTEQRFIELSGRIALQVARLPQKPESAKLVEPLARELLQQAGVGWEQFNAFAASLYADPARAQRVRDGVEEWVAQHASPEMQMREVPLPEAIQRERDRGENPPPRPAS